MLKSLSAFVVLLFSVVGLASGDHQGHSSELRVQAATITGKVLSEGNISYQFSLKDTDANKDLGDQDLQESHTKKLHFIAYDKSLNEFNHVHPVFTDGHWVAELTLPVNGEYFFWAQGELNDGTEFSAPLKAEITNGQAAHAVIDLEDHRTASDKGTIVTLSKRPIRAGKMAMVDYQVSREDGLSPIITPYLGAMAHVIAVSPDGEKMIHVHPMDGATQDTGMLHTTFPIPGDYRLWVQLNDRDELKTIPLSMTISK